MTLRAGKELVEFLRVLRALWEGRWKSPIPKENPLLIQTLRHSPQTARVLDDLKALKVVADNIGVNEIGDRYLGRLLTLWILLDLICG